MKHCQTMAAARQKAQEDRMAAQQKMDAAFQQVRAELDTAKNAKGEKKVAALEAALEKLVAFHDAMHSQMEIGGGRSDGPRRHGVLLRRHGRDERLPDDEGGGAPGALTLPEAEAVGRL